MQPTSSRREFLRTSAGLLAAVGASRVFASERNNDERPADASALLAPIMAEAGIPGAATLALRGDRIVAQGLTGVRRRGADDRITLHDRFHLGSCTKAMTATLVAMFVEEGKLKWTSTLAEVFGDSIKGMHPDWKLATLRGLLAHRAGLPANLGAMLTARLAFSDDPLIAQRAGIAAHFLARAPDATPGTTYRYSNLGYTLAGAALEKITGRAWEDLLRERLFQPLGISTGGFGAPGVAKGDQPWGHRGNDKTPVDPTRTRADNIAAIGPAGTAHMTITDWAKFVTLHLRGHPANPRRHVSLLSEASFAQLQRPAPGETYVGGWVTANRGWAKGARPEDAGATLSHGGSNTLWYCIVWMAPEIDFAAMVACNAAGEAVARTCDKAVGAMIRAYAPKSAAR